MRKTSVAVLAVLFCSLSFAQDKPVLTFVQITDAHVFDDGWRQPTDSGYRSVGDDWSSLHWAMAEINAMKSSGKNIDFVVYTGDLGLSNVELRNDCGLAGTPVDANGMPPISKDWAARRLASELSALSVPVVYFVPGNNDLEDENVTDARRLPCFLGFVQSALTLMSSPVRVSELTADAAVSQKGFRLAGLNSASFKSDTKYKASCPAAGPGCPEVEVGLLQKLEADTSFDPILVFTHIPDLVDPFRETFSWQISDPVRKQWNSVACNAKIMGIFAGHFHDSDRHLYASNTATHDLAVPGSECVAGKTWVAPPLAIKNQLGKNPTARGLLYVRIFKNGQIRVAADWFGGQ